MIEIWKKVVDSIFTDYYEVSNIGRVRRCVPAKGGRYMGIKNRLLTQWPDRDGYSTVSFVSGVAKVRKVHVLVARAFIGPCPLGKEVNHKDLDKGNNVWRNLEYKYPAQNTRHAIEAGVHSGKLSMKLAREIRRLDNLKSKSREELAKQFSVSFETIGRVCRRKVWNRAKGRRQMSAEDWMSKTLGKRERSGA